MVGEENIQLRIYIVKVENIHSTIRLEFRSIELESTRALDKSKTFRISNLEKKNLSNSDKNLYNSDKNT